MKLLAGKTILILSELIVINILVITNLLISNPKTETIQPTTYTTASIIPNKPKVGFSELLAENPVKPKVLSAQTEATPTPVPQPSKQSYTVAIIGDSMVETMGDSLDYIKADLEKNYPNTGFAMYNYGIGSENIEEALARFDKLFSHGGRNYVALPTLKPDILIIGSWAYNPLVPFDKNKHYQDLIEMGARAKQISPDTKVYMLAEIAPLKSGFGTGPGGVNWPAELANEQVVKITEQMQNVLVAAHDLDIPLIDVYDGSKIEGTNYGQEQYVSTHDHIHPSILGQEFTAENITQSLIFQ